jgi:sulfite reductase beta subunit-like hemoprotein
MMLVNRAIEDVGAVVKELAAGAPTRSESSSTRRRTACGIEVCPSSMIDSDRTTTLFTEEPHCHSQMVCEIFQSIYLSIPSWGYM